MDNYDQAARRVAIEFASAIRDYRNERNKTSQKGFVSATELVERLRESIVRKQQGVFSKLDVLTEQIAGMMRVVDAIGGIDFACKICDILEEMDDEEAESHCGERHFYVANFDRLADDYISDWVS